MSLLTNYNVIQVNEKTGVEHVNNINMAQLIINESEYNFHTIEDIDSGKQEIFYYKDGCYHKGGENRIKPLVDTYLGNKSNINRKREIIDYIKNQNYQEWDDLEPPLNLINLKNGIFNIDKKKLIPHDSKYFFIQQLPIIYDEKAECPKLLKFFEEVVYQNYIPVLQEMFGFILYRDYFLHKAFLFLGGGRNGKSSVIEIIANLIGKKNCATRSLHDLIENRFASSSLYGKMVNLGAEISNKTLFDTSTFKHLTGGDYISAEFKRRNAFVFKNYAKLVFNANKIPYTKYDKSLAFFQRWIIIVFPNTFEINSKGTDPQIVKKITTNKELSGLFNWSLIGLERLLKNYRFSDAIEENEIGEWYETLVSPEKFFMKEHLEEIEDIYLPNYEVYDEYKKWALERGYPVLTLSAFSRAIKKYFKTCDIVSHRINGNVTKCYKNINWRLDKMNIIQTSNHKIDYFNPESFIPSEEKREHIEKKISKDL